VSDNQAVKSQKRRSSPRAIALIGAGATALAIINMSIGSGEAQAQAVVILEYAALAGGLVALVGGLIMWVAQK
jgi:hypothetical protein